MRPSITAKIGLLVVAGLTRDGLAQQTDCLSLSPDGYFQPEGSYYPSISRDGRYVVLNSQADDFVGGDTNATSDVFLHDRQTGLKVRVSVSSNGAQADGPSTFGRVSASGRYVVFDSIATNLVASDSNAHRDVFVHDLATGETTRVSVRTDGDEANHESYFGSISADGRFVAFLSFASNLVDGDTNGVNDVFVHELMLHETTRISVDDTGAQGNDHSFNPIISADGSVVAFSSVASNLVDGDTNAVNDLFVHVLTTHTTARVSVGPFGEQANGGSDRPSLSEDGRYVAFDSAASNLVVPDTNDLTDVFVFDRTGLYRERVSVSSSGEQANHLSKFASLSADGRFVGFHSYASNLVPGDTNGEADVFLVDRVTRDVSRVSIRPSGGQGGDFSWYPSVSADGRAVAFQSYAELVGNDWNDSSDVFVHAPMSLSFRGTPAEGEHVFWAVQSARLTLAGDLALVMMSCSGTDGFVLPSGDTLFLTYDVCTRLGLPLAPLFSGGIDGLGNATTPQLVFPSVVAGVTIYCAAVSYNTGSGAFGSITPPIWFVTQ